MKYKKIIYPTGFNKNLGIGVTAPSSGLGNKTGIATAHGINFMDLIDSQNDPLSKQALEVLKKEQGEDFKQESSEKYQNKFVDFNDNIKASYNLTKPTKWKFLKHSTTFD